MKKKLIGTLDAAHSAGTSVKRIQLAMERGQLAWKALDGHQVTSLEWLHEWVSGKDSR